VTRRTLCRVSCSALSPVVVLVHLCLQRNTLGCNTARDVHAAPTTTTPSRSLDRRCFIVNAFSFILQTVDNQAETRKARCTLCISARARRLFQQLEPRTLCAQMSQLHTAPRLAMKRKQAKRVFPCAHLHNLRKLTKMTSETWPCLNAQGYIAGQ
jgi:hypothetical protein